MGVGILKWFSAGVITAGVSAAMIAGAGLAIADDEAGSDTGGTTTSQSSDTSDSEPGSATKPGDDSDETTNPDDTGTVDPDVDEKEPADEPAEEPTDEPAEEPAEEPADDDLTEDDLTTKKDGSDSDRADRTMTAPLNQAPTNEPDRNVTVEAEPAAKAVVQDDEELTASSISPIAEERTTVVIDNLVEDIVETPAVQAVAFASAPSTAVVDATATAPQIPGIIRVIGTIVFNLYAVATRLIGGPPILPANSTVTVRSSSLVLNCGCDDGDTIEVPADWYIPETEEGAPPPDRLIYLQHGFLASGPWYSHTAAALAEQTNSIVVAPTITSNFLAADACWLGAAPMHEAMAELFDDENTALETSAMAAGYAGPVPDRVVLIGHSLGGGAVSGIAGFMAQDDRIDNLAGVVLLDGVGLDGTMAESLDLVPDEIPIYQLAAPKYFWNQFGVGSDALLQARPGEFVGVTLVGGSHVDAMRGGNPLIQFSQQLVSGFSKPENVAAARMLMVGWVNDMFDPDQPEEEKEGIYLDPSEEFSFDTPAGEATVVALPNSLTKPFLLNPLQALVPLGNAFFTFEPACVAESVGAGSGCQEPIAA